MKKQFFYAILAIVFAVGNQSFSNADEVVIDTFDSGNQLIQSGPGTSTQSTVDALTIFGGQRDDSVTVPTGDTIGILTFNGNWEFTQGSSDTVQGSLVYDNFTDFDLTSGGTNSTFAIDVFDNDADFALTDFMFIELESAGTTQLVNFDIPTGDATPSSVFVDFSEFGSIDFTQVDSITLGFDAAGFPGRDFSINTFSAVPEPTSGIIGLGLLCGMFLRRKRSA